MDKGFYLYCIREKGNSEFSAEGIGGGKIFAIPYQDLEAVVSEVSLEEFGSEEIQRKAQEDLKWIREKAQHHEERIEEAMGKEKGKIVPVIPMQFGVIFKTKEKLEETLSKNLEKFRKILEYLTGKQEWGVKIYLQESIFRKTIKDKNEIVLAKKKEIERLSQGIAFFVQKQIDEIVNQEKDKELDKVTEELYENLGQLAFSKNKDKLLEKDFTGKIEEMVLNAFYLIEEKKLAQFQKKVEEFKGKYNPKGINVEMSGPWPSYHFA